MAAGARRGSAGERVLESRHVIGLFMLMLLFSGVFFTLGYVMGRGQYDGQVRAATDARLKAQDSFSAKPEPVSKRADNQASDTSTDTAAPPNSDWEFYHAGDSKKAEDHLKTTIAGSAPTPRTVSAAGKTSTAPRTASNTAKPFSAPPASTGAYTLQVAALTKEADALELATRLQKQRFPAFVLSPSVDKYYHVQVGPYADQKAAEAARKGLERAGFKAIVKH